MEKEIWGNWTPLQTKTCTCRLMSRQEKTCICKDCNFAFCRIILVTCYSGCSSSLMRSSTHLPVQCCAVVARVDLPLACVCYSCAVRPSVCRLSRISDMDVMSIGVAARTTNSASAWLQCWPHTLLQHSIMTIIIRCSVAGPSVCANWLALTYCVWSRIVRLDLCC